MDLGIASFGYDAVCEHPHGVLFFVQVIAAQGGFDLFGVGGKLGGGMFARGNVAVQIFQFLFDGDLFQFGGVQGIEQGARVTALADGVDQVFDAFGLVSQFAAESEAFPIALIVHAFVVVADARLELEQAFEVERDGLQLIQDVAFQVLCRDLAGVAVFAAVFARAGVILPARTSALDDHMPVHGRAAVLAVEQAGKKEL